MYADNDLLPLSGLQHLIFCERQCALIYVEQAWAENLFTAQGRVLHERVHEQATERRRDIRIEYGMPLRSLRLGLIGKADVIEFRRLDSGRWRPFPVEYKRGRNKPDDRDKVQLCAQAMCLEEMLDTEVSGGAFYYGRERHRTEVKFDGDLREKTEAAARRYHHLIESGVTPPPVYEKKCDACSLFSLCLPKATDGRKSVQHYLSEAARES